MNANYNVLKLQLHRQINHWEMASAELSNLEQSASPQAWASLETYVGVSLRRSLYDAVLQLNKESKVVRAMFEASRSINDLDSVWRQLISYRDRYLKTETLIDFFGHAVNTRTNPTLSAQLRALDILAMRSMHQLLDPLFMKTPPVLTYLDRGLGASILKAGLRLWDGTLSPVATIKITFHNRRRPTSLIHETGHQVAHMLNWTSELASSLSNALGHIDLKLADIWSSWASEVAADCFGFVHTGFASVAALSDVVGGDASTVFRYSVGDPHPISYIRVLFGVEMCRRFFGRGPWDELGEAWSVRYPLSLAPTFTHQVLQASLKALPMIVDVCLSHKMRAFRNQSLADMISPLRVSPRSLEQLEHEAGHALYSSTRWILPECIRLIALTGLRYVTHPHESTRITSLHDHMMNQLGGSLGISYVSSTA